MKKPLEQFGSYLLRPPCPADERVVDIYADKLDFLESLAVDEPEKFRKLVTDSIRHFDDYPGSYGIVFVDNIRKEGPFGFVSYGETSPKSYEVVAAVFPLASLSGAVSTWLFYKFAARFFKSSGVRLTTAVRTGNIRAIRLWLHLGFKPIGWDPIDPNILLECTENDFKSSAFAHRIKARVRKFPQMKDRLK